jgi:hypothetical protein
MKKYMQNNGVDAIMVWQWIVNPSALVATVGSIPTCSTKYGVVADW